MNFPIVYLQRSDFDSNGKLIHQYFKNKKTLVMLQANYCGFCTKAKPDFIRAAKILNNKVVFATAQLDGSVDGEKEIEEILYKIKPGFQGFPDYVLFENGIPRKDNGPDGRDVNSLIKFVN